MKPIYTPKGRAREYGEFAINIYTGCPHRCQYCFAPNVLRREREQFHSHVEPRPGIVEAVRRQLREESILDKLIHLCFACDPYPTGRDTMTTREIIKAIKESENHVQILTKGDGSRDFDLLDSKDWYGITYTGASARIEPWATSDEERLLALWEARHRGIRTWVSFEPVVNRERVLRILRCCHGYMDKVKIGKLNYYNSDINWAQFGREAEALCKELGIDYYIKDSLRAEMEGGE